jgi:hypothetical protein
MHEDREYAEALKIDRDKRKQNEVRAFDINARDLNLSELSYDAEDYAGSTRGVVLYGNHIGEGHKWNRCRRMD